MVVGDILRWIGPDAGEYQFDRIAATRRGGGQRGLATMEAALSTEPDDRGEERLQRGAAIENGARPRSVNMRNLGHQCGSDR